MRVDVTFVLPPSRSVISDGNYIPGYIVTVRVEFSEGGREVWTHCWRGRNVGWTRICIVREEVCLKTVAAFQCCIFGCPAQHAGLCVECGECGDGGTVHGSAENGTMEEREGKKMGKVKFGWARRKEGSLGIYFVQ